MPIKQKPGTQGYAVVATNPLFEDRIENLGKEGGGVEYFFLTLLI